MFNGIVDAKQVGPVGVGWNGIMPDGQEQNENETSAYEHVSNKDTGSMSTSTPNTSMDTTQTPPSPSNSMEINFNIYGSRFHSLKTGSCLAVLCLWDDTEVNYMQLDEIDDVFLCLQT